MYNRNCYLRLFIYLPTAIRKNRSTSLPLCKNKLNLLKGEQIRHENEKKKIQSLQMLLLISFNKPKRNTNYL